LGGAERESVITQGKGVYSMRHYKTKDWENSVTILSRCGWQIVVDIVAHHDSDKLMDKFITETLEVNLLTMIDKARQGRVVVIKEPKAELQYEWIRTEDGKFIKCGQPESELNDLVKEIEKTLKGVRESGILR
jgi:hypothetical protein